METDWAEQLDAVLNHSARALNKNQEVKETHTSTMLERDNHSPSLLDNRDTCTTIVMAEKKGYQSDINVT